MAECERLEYEYDLAIARLALVNRLTPDDMDAALDKWIERAEKGDTGGK